LTITFRKYILALMLSCLNIQMNLALELIVLKSPKKQHIP